MKRWPGFNPEYVVSDVCPCCGDDPCSCDEQGITCRDCTSPECHGVDPDDGQHWECPVLETVRKARR